MKLLTPLIGNDLEVIDDLAVYDNDTDSFSEVLFDSVSFAEFTPKNLAVAGSRFVKADFSNAQLEGLGFENVVANDCMMLTANFGEASWHTTEVINSRCSGVQLHEATLKNVTFRGCKLDMANFRQAKLTNVVFDGCVVTDMDFGSAELKNVEFIDCDIDGIDFTHATLRSVDFRESRLVKVKRPSDLKGAIITSQQLIYLAPQLAHEAGIKVED